MNNYLIEWKLLPKQAMAEVMSLFVILSMFTGVGLFFGNIQTMNPHQLTRLLWGQMFFYYGQFFMPIMLCIMVSLALYNEENSRMWAFLRQNNVSITKKIISKFLVICTLILFLQLFFFAVFMGVATFSGFSYSGSQILTYFKWLILSVLGAATIVSCQMLVSNYLRDFSKQVAFGVAAAFVGLALLMVFEPIGRIYPFSQVALALRARELTDFSAGNLILFLAVNIIFILVFLALSVRKLQKREF